MSFTPTAAAPATAETALRELPMPPWAYGVIAFVSLLLLLVVLWTFRNTAAKYDTPGGGGHGDSPGSPGAADHGAHH